MSDAAVLAAIRQAVLHDAPVLPRRRRRRFAAPYPPMDAATSRIDLDHRAPHPSDDHERTGPDTRQDVAPTEAESEDASPADDGQSDLQTSPDDINLFDGLFILESLDQSPRDTAPELVAATDEEEPLPARRDGGEAPEDGRDGAFHQDVIEAPDVQDAPRIHDSNEWNEAEGEEPFEDDQTGEPDGAWEDEEPLAAELDDPRENDGDDDDPGPERFEQAPDLTRVVEAILFASADPVSEADLAARMPEGADVAGILATLEADYRERGVNLVQVAGAWCMRTAPDLGFLLHKERVEPRKLSRAAIETLAIIAYHQPVTRAEIEDLRGVSVSKGTLDLLLEVGWARMRGRKPVPGRPITYGTTDAFLEHFGLAEVTDLPGLEEMKAAGLLDWRLPPDFAVPTPTQQGDMEGDGELGEDDREYLEEDEGPVSFADEDAAFEDEEPAFEDDEDRAARG